MIGFIIPSKETPSFRHGAELRQQASIPCVLLSVSNVFALFFRICFWCDIPLCKGVSTRFCISSAATSATILLTVGSCERIHPV